MDNVVFLMGRFANQLWEISAAIRVFGEGNFKVCLDACGEYERKAFENFQGIEVKEKVDVDDICIRAGYYQHKKWLCNPEVIKKYIKRPDDVPHLRAVIHLRLDDYIRNEEYRPYVVKRSYIDEACKRMGIDVKDFVVLSDSPQFVNRLYGDDLIVHEETDDLRAFWTLVEADYVIGSASTYSYWACYLNHHKEFALPLYWKLPTDDVDVTMAKCVQDLLWF